MGRSRHGAQLAVIQPSFRHRGFDSSPTHEQQCASRLTGRAPGSYPGEDWVRGPGRARIHAAVAQRSEQLPVEQKATGSSPAGGAIRRRSPMERAPAYEAGGCRFDPCRRRPPRRSSVERAPPSEGERRTFDSCRRGRANPALGAAHGRDPAGSGARLLTGYGVTPVRVRVSPLPPLPRKRPGWMRSLSRKQVRV